MKDKKKENDFSLLHQKLKRDDNDSLKKAKSNFNKLLNTFTEKRKKEYIEEKDGIIPINPISDYVSKKKEEWEKGKLSNDFSKEKFSASIAIIQDFNYNYLNKLLSDNDMNNFVKFYEFSQFTLTANQRKEFQKNIENKCNSIILKKNFIPDKFNDIKELFIGLCNSIINIKNCVGDNFPEKLKETILTFGIYSENKFESFIPVGFANRELKFNKLIFEIVDFFFQSSMKEKVLDNNKIYLIRKKFLDFKLFKEIFEKSNLYSNDDELFSVINYLFNCIYIYYDATESQRDFELLKKIILCCMPFEIERAKNFLSEIADIIDNENLIKIDNLFLGDFKISDITGESKISFTIKNIEVKCKDINFNLQPSEFLKLLESDKFMLCFRFPKLSEMNYLCINNNIRDSYNNLFKKIMKSKIMKLAMNKDADAKLFQYPFNKDEILEEIEKNCFLVPLPAKNYYGISDRASFSIYLNSFIDTSKKEKVLIDIDNITKSKCHEIKHMYRVYIHIAKPDISLNSPEISSRKLDQNELTLNNNDFFKEKRELMEYIYSSKKILINQNDEKIDYGDVLEFVISGNKQNLFFPLNSLFYLSEKSCEMEFYKFENKYFMTCYENEFLFRRNKDNIFINNIIEYLKLKTNVKMTNSPDYSKRAKENTDEPESYENKCYFIPRASHFRK